MAHTANKTSPVLAPIGTAVRTRRGRGLFLALALIALAIQRTSAGALSSVSPSGATPGVTLPD